MTTNMTAFANDGWGNYDGWGNPIDCVIEEPVTIEPVTKPAWTVESIMAKSKQIMEKSKPIPPPEPKPRPNAWAKPLAVMVHTPPLTKPQSLPSKPKPIHREEPAEDRREDRSRAPEDRSRNRSKAFERMKDPEDRMKRLHRTQPCSNGPKCKRTECGYYHSVEERKLPMCIFGSDCRKKHKCSHVHPGQEDGWIRRNPPPKDFPAQRASRSSSSRSIEISASSKDALGLFKTALAAGKTEIVVKII